MYICKRWVVVLLLGLVLSATACGSLPQSGEVEPTFQPLSTLRVCSSQAATQMNMQMAQAEQLDKKYGLNLDVTVVNNSATMVAALMAGDFDLCQTGGATVVSAVAGGGDLVIVGGVLNRQPYYLITRPEIAKPADLMGKAVAVNGLGSSSDFAIRTALRHLGLEPDKDVTIVGIGGTNDRLAAMETGKVVGTILAPPEAMITVAQGGNVLLDFADLNKDYQHIAVITTRKFVREHPDLLTAYLKATSEAVARMQADKARTIEVMANYLALDPTDNAKELELTYDMFIAKQFHIEPMPSIPGIQALIDELARENPDVAHLTPDDLVDLSIVEQLQKEGFFQSWQSQ